MKNDSIFLLLLLLISIRIFVKTALCLSQLVLHMHDGCLRHDNSSANTGKLGYNM